MSIRFRLFPGVRLNVGKQGVSASFGVPGATLNVGPRGVRGTVGVPGSGLSYSTMLLQPLNSRTPPEPRYWTPADFRPGNSQSALSYAPPQMREIGSAAVENLTSAGLFEFRQMLIDARAQRHEIEADLTTTAQKHRAQSRELRDKKRSWLRFLFKKRIVELEEKVPLLAAEIEHLQAWRDATFIEVQFETDDQAQRGYGGLIRAYDDLKASTAIWDVTKDRNTNKVAERTTASRIVERKPVRLDYSKSDLIRFSGQAMRFANANGEDLLIYPGMILMERSDGAFGLLDLREIGLKWRDVSFIEEERVPADTQVIGQTWAKANKDGSPDLRFNNNYQIPVCRYGQLAFESPTGLTEEYQFSNSMAAAAFEQAFIGYQRALATTPQAQPTDS